jgi:glycosyltransferase involved in cell wall biosynthesis
VTGKVPDVRPYLAAASVAAVPLRQGSGTRIKILEAFAARKPVVSTTVGAAGLDVRDGRHLLLADDELAMSKAIMRLWDEPHLARAITTAAHELVCREYSWESAARAAARAISSL